MKKDKNFLKAKKKERSTKKFQQWGDEKDREGWEGALRRQKSREAMNTKCWGGKGEISYGGDCQVWGRGSVIHMRGVWWGDKLWWWEYKESVMNYILQEFRDLVLCGLFKKDPWWRERSEKELFLDFGWNLHGELGSCWTGKAEVTTWGEFRSIQEYSTDPPILHYGCHLKLLSSQYFISD